MADGDFKNLPRRTASDKVLSDKSFNNARNPKYNGYQREFTSMVYKFFGKSLLVPVFKVNLYQTSNN